MEKNCIDLYKKQKLEIFEFDLDNLKELTIDYFLEIINIHFFSLRFKVLEQDFLNYFKYLGFVKYESSNFNLKLELNDDIILLSYNKIEYDGDYVQINNIKTNNQNISLNYKGNLAIRHYDKNVTDELFETWSQFRYETETINDLTIEYLDSIHYFYQDDRKNILTNFKLYSIVEYPIQINEMKVSVFDPIYHHFKNDKTLKVSQLLLNFDNEDIKLFGMDNTHRYNIVDLNNIFSTAQIDILNIVVF